MTTVVGPLVTVSAQPVRTFPIAKVISPRDSAILYAQKTRMHVEGWVGVALFGVAGIVWFVRKTG